MVNCKLKSSAAIDYTKCQNRLISIDNALTETNAFGSNEAEKKESRLCILSMKVHSLVTRYENKKKSCLPVQPKVSIDTMDEEQQNNIFLKTLSDTYVNNDSDTNNCK